MDKLTFKKVAPYTYHVYTPDGRYFDTVSEYMKEHIEGLYNKVEELTPKEIKENHYE